MMCLDEHGAVIAPRRALLYLGNHHGSQQMTAQNESTGLALGVPGRDAAVLEADIGVRGAAVQAAEDFLDHDAQRPRAVRGEQVDDQHRGAWVRAVLLFAAVHSVGIDAKERDEAEWQHHPRPAVPALVTPSASRRLTSAVAACDEALVAGDEQFVAVLHRHRAWDIAAGLGEAEAPTELA
jgi:hypothetical protein